MSEESIVVFLRAQIGEFSGKMREASAETEAFAKSGGSSFGKFSQFSSAALLAVGVAAIAVGAYGVKMANEYEKSHARLETAVKNTGGDFEELKGKVGATDKTMENLGFTNADTESSIATLTAVTHSAEKAMSLQTLAADLARGKNIDLATATNALVKVEGGRYALLGRLLGLSKEQVGAIHNEHDATKLLTDLYGGQAKAYTETFAGKIEVLKTKGIDLGKNIGLMVIPVIEELATVLMGAVTFIQNANDATGGWIGKLALVGVTGVLVVGAVTKLIAVGTLLEAKLVSIAAKFIVVDEAGVVTASTLGIIAGALAGVGIAAAAVYGSMKLLEAIEPDPNAAWGKWAKETSKTLQETGAVSTKTGKELAENAGVSADALNVYRDALISGKSQSEAFGLAVKANADFGPAYTKELRDWTGDVDKYVAGLSASEKAQSAVTVAQEKYNNDLALGHSPQAVLHADLTAVAAAKRHLTVVTEADTVKQNAAGVATKEQIKQTKELTTALDKYGGVAGPVAEKVADSMHLTRDAVDQLTSSTKKMNDGIDKAFNDAGSVIDAWTQKGSFDLAKFEADLLSDTMAAANWSKNIATLSKAGIDQGFLQTLIDAGPKSAKVVQGLVDGVSKGSVTAINSIEATGRKAAGSAKSTVDGSLLGIRASFEDFIRFVNSAHPNLDVRIAGQSATASQIHSLAVAEHSGGQIKLAFAQGGRVPGPKGAPVPAIVHGGEFVVSNEMQSQSLVAGGSPSAPGGGVLVQFGDVHVEGTNLSPSELEQAFENAVHRLTPTLVQGIVGWQRAGNGKLVDHLEHAS